VRCAGAARAGDAVAAAAPVRPRLPALLALALALGVAAPARAEDSEARLEALQEAIEGRRERIDAFERRERGLLETLEAMEESAALLSEARTRARAELEAARIQAAALARNEADLATQLAATRRALAARAVALYKAGELGPVRLLFSAGSLPDFLARTRALRRVMEHDRTLLARQRSEAAALAEARARSEAAARERDAALATLRERSRELEAERAARARVLASVRGDRDRERAALLELERAARALEEKLADLDARRRGPAGAGDFAALRGHLPAPVAASVVRGFGRQVDREFGTQTFRKGVDFDAPPGTTVRAVAPGTVRFAGRFRGYGNLVILDHGDGWFTVSAHLDDVAVEVGDAVESGAVVGKAGESGSLRGPVLYFEIRRGDRAVDPAEWLAPQESS